jgi:hypothetical protein
MNFEELKNILKDTLIDCYSLANELGNNKIISEDERISLEYNNKVCNSIKNIIKEIENMKHKK